MHVIFSNWPSAWVTVASTRRVAGNTLWQALNQLSNGAGNFALAFILGRGLGPEEFGLFAVATATAQTVTQLFDVRVQDLVVIFVTRFRTEGEEGQVAACLRFCNLVVLWAGLCGMILLYLSLPWTAQHLVRDVRGYALVGLAGLATWLTLGVSNYQQGVLRALGRFSLACGCQLFGQTLRLAGSVLLVVCGHGVADLMAWSCLSAAGQVVLQQSRIAAALTEEGVQSQPLKPAHRLEFYHFMRTNYLIGLSGLPIASLDLNLLSYVSTPSAVGQYRLAKTFMGLVGLVGDAVVQVLQPELVRLWVRQRNLLGPSLKRLTLLGGFLGTMGYLICWLALPAFVQLTLGPGFELSAQLFFSMAWGVVGWSFFLWLNPLLLAAGRIEAIQRGALLSGLIVLAAYFHWIPLEGVWGAAWVTGASWIVFVVVIGVFGVMALREEAAKPPLETEKRPDE